MLSVLAMHNAELGDTDLALERIHEAVDIDLAGAAPMGLITSALVHTLILSMASAAADEVAAAARPGLEAAAAWGIETYYVSMIRGNVAEVLRRSGQIEPAAELIDPVTTELAPTVDSYPAHGERASLDLLRGRVDESLARFEILATLPNPLIWNRMDLAERFASAELWSGRPQRALDRLRAMLDESLGTDADIETTALLVLAAQAAADIAASTPPESSLRRKLLNELAALPPRASADPFASHPAYGNREALSATWKAELARLAGEPALERWVSAAQAWDRLNRPYDAALQSLAGRHRGATEQPGRGGGPPAPSCGSGCPGARPTHAGDQGLIVAVTTLPGEGAKRIDVSSAPPSDFAGCDAPPHFRRPCLSLMGSRGAVETPTGRRSTTLRLQVVAPLRYLFSRSSALL